MEPFLVLVSSKLDLLHKQYETEFMALNSCHLRSIFHLSLLFICYYILSLIVLLSLLWFRQEAAGALWNLSFDDRNREAIAAAGGVEALVWCYSNFGLFPPEVRKYILVVDVQFFIHDNSLCLVVENCWKCHVLIQVSDFSYKITFSQFTHTCPWIFNFTASNQHIWKSGIL